MPFLKLQKTSRQRLGEAGLASLMRDPRYFDSRHPDHRPLNKLVQRGFELVFDEPAAPEGGVRRPEQPFAEAVRRLASDKTGDEGGGDAALDALPPTEHARFGRRAVLGALKADGARFPPGFETELAESPPRDKTGKDKPPEPDKKKSEKNEDLCATRKAHLEEDLVAVEKIEKQIDAANQKIAIMEKRIDYKKKQKP
jgi:hypothetical protein